MIVIVLYWATTIATWSAAARQASVDAAKPAAVNGLEVTIQPLRPDYGAEEHIGLKVTFRNITGAAFRLPDRVDSPDLRSWRVMASNLETGQRWTAIHTGDAVRPGTPPFGECERLTPFSLVCLESNEPVMLDAHQTLETVVPLSSFGFLEGTLDITTAHREARQNGSSSTLPPGLYAISLYVDFPVKYRLDGGIPIWHAGSTSRIETNVVRVRISTSPR